MKKHFTEIQDLLEIRYGKKRPIREFELNYLQSVVKKLPYNSTVLEIGSFIGKSSVCIAEALEYVDGVLTCVDNFSENYPNQETEFLQNISGYKNIQIEKSTSEDFFKSNKKFDMCYIDGNHTIDGFVLDLSNSIHLCKVVCGHDFHISYPWIIDSIQFLAEKFNITYEAHGYVWRLYNTEVIQELSVSEISDLLQTRIKSTSYYYLR